jgi:O-antigen biosynthesis protein
MSELSGAVGGVPERFVPAEMRGELVEAEHIARYRWASRFAAGRRTLDAGCGVGYGARLLAAAGASSVTAVDLSQAIVDVARGEGAAGIDWDVADVRALSYPDASFDLVVCFEVIEHVDEQDQVLDELARVLAPDGLLVISSPNRDRYVPGNPHHRHEFTPDELRATLERRFPTVRLVAQHAMVASAIGLADASTAADAEVLQLVEPAAGDDLYTLALAGSRLPPEPPPLVAVTQFFEVRRWLEFYDQQARTIEEQSAALGRADVILHERGDALGRLAVSEQQLAELPELRERLANAAASLEPLQAHGDRVGLTGDRAGNVLREMEASISWRITAPLRAAKRLLLRRRAAGRG